MIFPKKNDSLICVDPGERRKEKSPNTKFAGKVKIKNSSKKRNRRSAGGKKGNKRRWPKTSRTMDVLKLWEVDVEIIGKRPSCAKNRGVTGKQSFPNAPHI